MSEEFEGLDFPMEEREIEVPPSGWQDAEIVKVSATKSESTGRQGVMLNLTITSGELEGRRVIDRIWFPMSADQGMAWGKTDKDKFKMMFGRAIESMASTGFKVDPEKNLGELAAEFVDMMGGSHVQVRLRNRYKGFDGEYMSADDAFNGDGELDLSKVMEVESEVAGYKPL